MKGAPNKVVRNIVGGVSSPLLANVYLDRLDRYVANDLIPRFTRGKWKKADPRWHSLQNQIWGRRQKGVPDEELKPMRAEQRALRSRNQFDPGYRRLRYIRYADDFILGFDGPKAEADEIRTLLGTFLREQLKLELSPEKTLITHAETEQARFLGYDISTGMNGGISLRIPPRVLEEKIARYSKGGKPHPRRELTDDADFSIVATYGLEYRGFVQYYAYARNRFWLHHLQWVMRSSLLKSLAGKHKSSVTKMAERYTAKAITKNGVGTCLMVVIEREGKPPLVAQFGGISLSPEPLQVIEDAPLGRDRIVHHTEIVARLLADECEVCGSKENVQVHHIRKLADLKVGREETPHWKKVMASRKRKTLLVCDYCHKAIHAGRPTRSPDSKG